jgi:hypothetical protein
MTNNLAESMFDPLVNVFFQSCASEYYEVLNSRDIVKVVRCFEKKYREIIAPIAKEHPWIAMLAEELAGQKTGKLLGNLFVEEYESLSSEKKAEWDSSRWLHHGAIGLLLAIRESKKNRPFLVGLGRGLMISDLQDQSEWFTPEYKIAKKALEQMR